MQISIKLPNNKTIIVDIKPDMKVIEIKNYIMSKYPFDLEIHELIYNGYILKDDSTVSKINIKTEATLYLVANKAIEKSSDPNMISITIFSSEKETFNLNVKKDDKISELKQRVKTKIGNQMDLFYKGQKLDDSRTVEECSIAHNEILTAILAVHGGFN